VNVTVAFRDVASCSLLDTKVKLDFTYSRCLVSCYGCTTMHTASSPQDVSKHSETMLSLWSSLYTVAAVTPYTRYGVERDVWDHNDLQEGRSYVTARLVTPTGQYSHALLYRRKVALLVNSVRTCLIVGSEGSHSKE
jgi:hypothetical protein